MEKELEPIGIDISGYSEKKTDMQVDQKIGGGQTVKQFNRIVKSSKKQIKSGTIFEEK